MMNLKLHEHLHEKSPVKNMELKNEETSHSNMRTPFRKGTESTFDFEATRIPQLKTKQRIGLQNKTETNI